MRALIQRVKSASVSVDGKIVGSAGEGLFVLVGVFDTDTESDASALAERAAKLRVFSDGNGKMNLSLLDISGEALVVSNFTLCADNKKGNRPSYARAMEPGGAKKLYELFCDELEKIGVSSVGRGVFGADMTINSVADGPVTVMLDTEDRRKK